VPVSAAEDVPSAACMTLIDAVPTSAVTTTTRATIFAFLMTRLSFEA
jgi:hypothetical protein